MKLCTWDQTTPCNGPAAWLRNSTVTGLVEILKESAVKANCLLGYIRRSAAGMLRDHFCSTWHHIWHTVSSFGLPSTRHTYTWGLPWWLRSWGPWYTKKVKSAGFIQSEKEKSEEGDLIAAFSYLSGRRRKDWGRILLEVHSRELWGKMRESMWMVKRVILIRYWGGKICNEKNWTLE